VSKERPIAVIDDDGPFRAALVELLSSSTFGARGFASAEEFLASRDAHLYDCIIADFHMPGMTIL
jgi:FixJ family two-component response regulator